MPPPTQHLHITHTGAHTCMQARTHTRTRVRARTHTRTPLYKPHCCFQAKLCHKMHSSKTPAFLHLQSLRKPQGPEPWGEMCQKKNCKETLKLCKLIKYLSGLRYIFNNPINTESSFECLFAAGKTLFPRQIRWTCEPWCWFIPPGFSLLIPPKQKSQFSYEQSISTTVQTPKVGRKTSIIDFNRFCLNSFIHKGP